MIAIAGTSYARRSSMYSGSHLNVISLNAAISRGYVVCPLYRGCLLFRVSIFGGPTVYKTEVILYRIKNIEYNSDKHQTK